MPKLEELKGNKRKRLLYDFEKLKKYIEEYQDICEQIEAIKLDNLPLRLNNIVYSNAYYQGMRNAFGLIHDMMVKDKQDPNIIKAVIECALKSLENTERIMRDDPMKFCPKKDKKGKIIGYEAHFTRQIIIADD